MKSEIIMTSVICGFAIASVCLISDCASLRKQNQDLKREARLRERLATNTIAFLRDQVNDSEKRILQLQTLIPVTETNLLWTNGTIPLYR